MMTISSDERETTAGFSTLEWIRLWFSYQRYGMLLVGLALALCVGSWMVWQSWWVTVPAGLSALFPFYFGMNVLSRWPDKIRATKLAVRRQASGRFAPEDVRSFCGDPCFRVVAHELLSRAGVSWSERRRIIAELRGEVERDNRVGVMIDHRRGIVTRVEDGKVTHHPLRSFPPPSDVGELGELHP